MGPNDGSGPSRPTGHGDFEIVIICALPLEADAIYAILDARWEDKGMRFDKVLGDPNAYTPGVIGRHNVLLAHMPEMGKVSAAVVANNCHRSFSNIKLAIICGICGIVPFGSKDKERILGDIVISSGIVQYDFGRQTNEGWKRKDTLLDNLGRPNTQIRSMIAKLQGNEQHDRFRDDTSKNLQVLQNNPSLAALYPGKVHDKLYETDCIHENGDEVTCNAPSVQRQRLQEAVDPKPAIHFGVLGSSDSIMRSSKKRDAIAQKEDIIAFEMEGAGVWDTFPCLVIKGACDYADSHKNKIWQRYAAASAAACTKAFLNRWAPSTGLTHDDWSGEPREKEVTKAEKIREIQPWLLDDSLSDDKLSRVRYSDSVKDREDGTCNWVLNHPLLLEWCSSESVTRTGKLLWINGLPGFGKTILCARLVELLLSPPEVPVGYFFFSDAFVKSRTDPFVAIRSWISQIMSQNTDVFNVVNRHRRNDHNNVATRETTLKIIKEILQIVPNCTLVADGVDECTSDTSRFLDAVMDAVSSTSRVIIVSREDADIRQSLTGHKTIRTFEVKLSRKDVSEDTALYAKSIVRKQLLSKDKRVKDDISRRLADKCEGQFLWLKMQKSRLKNSLTQSELNDSIDETLPGLECLYQRNWNQIADAQKVERYQAIRLLRWVAFALRPLKVCEIAEAVRIRKDTDFSFQDLPGSVDEHRVHDQILEICGSLLESRSTSSEQSIGMRTVHLAHSSVKQYMLSNEFTGGPLALASEDLRASNEKKENTLLAKLCLRFIMSYRSSNHGSRENTDFPTVSFWEYASASWYRHVALGLPDDTDLIRLLNNFFVSNSEAWASWRTWFDLNCQEDTSKGEPGQGLPPYPLYYASVLNLTETSQLLIREQACTINHRSIQGQTALYSASEKGNDSIVKMLLEAGADTTIVTHQGWTPLHVATLNGHMSTVQHLLDRDANVMAVGNDGWTPLHAASRYGHLSIVQLLCDTGADVRAMEGNGWTPVHSATHNGYEEVIHLLLSRGAEVNVTDKNDWTPLHEASRRGHMDLVKLFLKRDAYINAANITGTTPLLAASRNGHSEIVGFLLDQNADIMAADQKGVTALQAASCGGHTKVVELLLKNNADIRAANKLGFTSLHHASQTGHEEVANLLLKEGSDIEARDKWMHTPLQAASKSGYLDTVMLLLRNKANIKARNDIGFTSLHLASEQGHKRVVERLLEAGADITATDQWSWTPLHAAADNGHLEIASLLLQKKANINAKNCAGVTPLQAASHGGNAEVVKLLLENKANIKVSDNIGFTPLHAASRRGHVEVVDILLCKGADIMSMDQFRWTPLHAASQNGRIEVVKVLLKTVAIQINVHNQTGITPLQAASRGGHTETVKLLLQNEANIEGTNDIGLTSLHHASDHGHLEVVEVLLNAGAYVMATDQWLWTPLHAASHKGHTEVVKLLLDREARINAKNVLGITPLFAAAQSGHIEVVKLLVRKRADIDASNHSGFTPLYMALNNRHGDVVKFLLEQGARVDIVLVSNQAPL